MWFAKFQTNSSSITWYEVSYNIPDFYKNYTDLNSLVSALNDRLHIKYTWASSAQTVKTDGYGVAICWSASLGKTAIYWLHVGNASAIAGDDPYFTFTKVGEHEVNINCTASFGVIWLGQ